MISSKLPPTLLNVTWKEFEKTGEELAFIIHKSNWEFDQILCVARGGMFIGDMLSRVFKKPLAVISASSYSDESKNQGKLTISDKIAMTTDSLGKKLLLVDDLVDSGATLQAVRETIKKQNPGIDIRTAVLWKKTNSKLDPDFYAKTVAPHVWIIQPQEEYDDVSPESLNPQRSTQLVS